MKSTQQLHYVKLYWCDIPVFYIGTVSTSGYVSTVVTLKLFLDL